MAEKMVLMIGICNAYDERLIDYKFEGGFASSQRRRSVDNLHQSIKKIYPRKRILEISTKLDCDLEKKCL